MALNFETINLSLSSLNFSSIKLNSILILFLSLSPALNLAHADQSENLEATFDSIHKLIIQPKCLKCHKTGGKAEDLPFETKDQVLGGVLADETPLIEPGKALESGFFRSVNPDPDIRGDLTFMPPKKDPESKPLSSEELLVLETWINAGATN